MNFDNCFSHQKIAVLYLDVGVWGPDATLLKWPLVREHERYSVLQHLLTSNKLFAVLSILYIYICVCVDTHTHKCRNSLSEMWLLSLSISWQVELHPH
jgi:hypothetical protein